MSNDDLRRLFDTVLAEAHPDTTDVGAAMRAGRARRRRRNAGVVVSSAAVITAVAVVLAGSASHRSTPPSEGAGGASPTPTQTSGPAVTVTSADQLLGTWRTVELDGQDVRSVGGRDGDPLFASFGRFESNGKYHWGANDGCNFHSGTLTVSRAGRMRTEGAATTLVGCSGGVYSRNPEVVQEATQARIVPATPTAPARLLLLAGEKVVAQYDAVPSADGQRRPGTVLVSGPSQDPGSGMAALVTGKVTMGKDGCVGLDGQTAVFPQGTSWASALGVLMLPDGSTAQLGDTVSGGGGYLPASNAKGWVADPAMSAACTWSPEVRVFNRGAQVTVGR